MPVEKILIVTLSNLGDVILTLPVFQSLSAAYPRARFHVVTSDRAKIVFEGDSRVERVNVYDRRSGLRAKLDLLRNVRAERYDLIIDLRKSFIGFFGGAKRRNAYCTFRLPKHRGDRHRSAVLKFAPPDAAPFLRTAALPPHFLTESESRPLVVAAPGSKSDIKKWPAEYFARVLDRLALEDGMSVVLVGDASDAPDAERVRKSMRAPSTDLTGKTSFQQLASLLRQAALVMTNDSAPLHLADSLGVPVIALFGPTDPQKYGPRGASGAALTVGTFCSPCESPQCRQHHECMTELSPERVYASAAAVLNQSSRAGSMKILVVRLDRIGDVLLSLPAVNALRRRFPDSHISMMVRPATRELVDGHPDLDEVIVYQYEKKGRHSGILGNWRFIREIVKKRFDAVFVLHPGNRSVLVPFAAGIPYRIGFGARASSWFLTTRVPDRRHQGARHEAEYAMDVVRAFGAESAPVREVKVPVYADETAEINALLEREGCRASDGLVAFHAGASCPSKRWPIERFIELGKKILADSPSRIAVIGGAGEIGLGRQLRDALGERCVDFTGRLSLRQSAALLKRCELLVSNDSGPVHLAAAVGTRTLTLFGRNRAGLGVQRWRALGAGHETMQKDVGCQVCLAHRCTIDFECLRAIAVEEVFARFKTMLSPASFEKEPA